MSKKSFKRKSIKLQKSKSQKYKSQKSKKNKKSKNKNHYTINFKKIKRSYMKGGYVSCNDKLITEPGFQIPVLGRAPGLSIPESKIVMSSSNMKKIEHPMII